MDSSADVKTLNPRNLRTHALIYFWCWLLSNDSIAVPTHASSTVCWKEGSLFYRAHVVGHIQYSMLKRRVLILSGTCRWPLPVCCLIGWNVTTQRATCTQPLWIGVSVIEFSLQAQCGYLLNKVCAFAMRMMNAYPTWSIVHSEESFLMRYF